MKSDKSKKKVRVTLVEYACETATAGKSLHHPLSCYVHCSPYSDSISLVSYVCHIRLMYYLLEYTIPTHNITSSF